MGSESGGTHSQGLGSKAGVTPDKCLLKSEVSGEQYVGRPPCICQNLRPLPPSMSSHSPSLSPLVLHPRSLHLRKPVRCVRITGEGPEGGASRASLSLGRDH